MYPVNCGDHYLSSIDSLNGSLACLTRLVKSSRHYLETQEAADSANWNIKCNAGKLRGQASSVEAKGVS